MSSTSESVHLWYHCHGCGSHPIAGRRYTCTSCPAGPDNDLCEPCYRKYQRGEIAHPAEYSLASAVGIREHAFESSDGEPREKFLAWLEPVHPLAADPAVPDRFVLRPEFRSAESSYLSSYAFAVKAPAEGPPVVVTALHVMDELIKKNGIDATEANADYTGREVPGLVTKVILYDVFAANWILAEIGEAGPMLVLPGARTGGEEPISDRDIAAFRVRSTGGLAPGELAPRRPDIGDPVWLAAKLEGAATGRTVKAVVVESTAQTLVFRFEDPSFRAPYSSGAPIVDRAGRVVGLNVGAGWLDGRRLGHANHVDNIRRHLDEGLRQP